MPTGLGNLSKMGFVNVASWTTAFTTSGEVCIPFLDEGITTAFTRIEKEAKIGSAGREPSEQGNKAVSGPVNFELDYYNFGPIFKAIFGDASSPYDISEDDLPIYNWIEFEKTVERWRFGPVKPTKLVISGEKDSIVKASVDFIVRDLERSATAFSPSVPTTRTRVRFNDLVLRIADQANAMAGGDALEIESFEFEFDRGLKTDDYVNAQEVIEPVPGDWRAVSLKIKVPRYTANTFQGWKDADTPLMADLTFSRSPKALLIQLPELRISEGFDVETTGPDPYVVEGGLMAYRSVNSNMYVGNECRITVT